jgi:quercetin dioxygenase-like cupin family protein
MLSKLLLTLGLVAAASADIAKASGEIATVLSRREIANIPGKSFVSVLVAYPPGAKSPPHRHARSGLIYAYVLSGAIRSGTDDRPPQVFHAGESWFEPPGARHSVSENASDAEPARLLAIFVVDTAEPVLTTPDHR